MDTVEDPSSVSPVLFLVFSYEPCYNALYNYAVLCNNLTKCNKFLLRYIITPTFCNYLLHFAINSFNVICNTFM